MILMITLISIVKIKVTTDGAIMTALIVFDEFVRDFFILNE